MSSRRFNFVSPGIEVQEVDNTGRPDAGPDEGPAIVGRALRGPGVPISVRSNEDFIQMFGDPIAGPTGGDSWRDQPITGPTYGAFGVRNWLKNSPNSVFVRLMGEEHPDASAAGRAGWATAKEITNDETTNGGAYGIFVFNNIPPTPITDPPTPPDPPPGMGNPWPEVSGTLAAVIYLQEGSVSVSGGTWQDVGTPVVEKAATLVSSANSSNEFRIVIRDAAGALIKETNFNFNPSSQKFIRKVLNTNASLTNAGITSAADLQTYWLGETYEREVTENITVVGDDGVTYAAVMGLSGGASFQGSDYKFGHREPSSGWVFSQDLDIADGNANAYDPENMTKLFRLVGLHNGEWESKNIKISIEDIKSATSPQSPYGSFAIVVRKSSDSDAAPVILERFGGCNLNPHSSNYVARKVGDSYLVWDDVEKKYDRRGNFANQSRYLRVEMNPTVDAGGVDPASLPFGAFGPLKHRDVYLDSTLADPATDDGYGTAFPESFLRGGGTGGMEEIPNADLGANEFIAGDNANGTFRGVVRFPSVPLRQTSATGEIVAPRQARFGVDTNRLNLNKFEKSYFDLVRPLPAGFSNEVPTLNGGTETTQYSWIFSLDDLSDSSAAGHADYVEGSRALGTSISASAGNDWKSVLTAGFDKFTITLHGGHDGLDILETEPFRNSLLSSAPSEVDNYAFYSMKRAIDSLADTEELGMRLLSVPGLTNDILTDKVIQVAEMRNDCMAIIDLEGDYEPESENNLDESSRSGSVNAVVNLINDRDIDSSYAASYYPWVRARDTISGKELWTPPSIHAIGAISYSKANAEIWFAPAGFTRGGLSTGDLGMPVVATRERLRLPDRDKLQSSNINPITSIPRKRDIVIYGQRTLSANQDKATSRVNVRLLMNELKAVISRAADKTLFEQNNPSTWNRFLSKVNPFLRSVQSRFGIDQFKVILDETTTTPELRDRNIMYAKILVTPTRSIENIILEFNISNSGVSFDD